MGSDHAARLIAEADKCAGDAARIRAFARTLDRPHVVDELLVVAARLEESSVKLRSLAEQIR
ncbi:MAG: hypothetical protein ACM30I_00880 [Gemmatimonas sp.]